MLPGQPNFSSSDNSPLLTKRQNIPTSFSPQMAPSSATANVPHLFPLLPVLRLTTHRIRAAANDLTPLAPDAHLDDLQRRVLHLAYTLRAHCHLEQNSVLPALREFVPPPQKRARLNDSSSPLINFNHHQLIDFRDYPTLHQAFINVTDALSRLRTAPLLSGDSASPNTVRRVSDDLPFTSLPIESINSNPNDSNSSPISSSPLMNSTNNNTNSSTLSRSSLLSTLLESTKFLEMTVCTHLDALEEEAIPIFTTRLSPTEKGNLILQTTLDAVDIMPLADAFRFVTLPDLYALCSYLVQYANMNDLKQIGIALAKVVSAETWRCLCAKLPIFSDMVVRQHDSLVEILQIHKAISKELKDIVSYCESIDISDQKQVQSLAARFEFLKKVHSCHVEGEETVLLKELQTKLRSSPCSSTASTVYEEHCDETTLFSHFAQLLSELQIRIEKAAQNGQISLKTEKKNLVEAVHNVTDHIIKHMKEEETNLLPLVRKHFSLEDQDRMMKLIMAKVPAEFTLKVIPWIFNSLEVDDQETMLRNILRTSPRDRICKILASIAESVRKGIIDRTIWNEICLRLPEVEEQYKSLVDVNREPHAGPVSEILRVHKAFRIELNDLLNRAKEIAADGNIPNPHILRSLAESLAFLRKMVEDHSHAEDTILLPRLEEKVPGISTKYKDDHGDERKLFQDLAKCLEELQCIDDETECEGLLQKLHIRARILRDEMESHLCQEEEQLWPLLTKLFTPEEQSEIVAMIFGHMSEVRLRELLPWMIRMLSVSERNTMMNHILQVTQSTMFEKWLKTWLPLEEETKNQPATSTATEEEANKLQTQPCKSKQDLPSDLLDKSNPDVASTARVLLQGRDNIERTIRALARDSSLSVKERTRMMQQVMLAPYSQARANALASRKTPNNGSDDLTASYVTGKDGTKRLGCRHYLRACKVRASCCGRLYTCRLCHDDAEQTHIMDRVATTEIVCMHCKTLQPVSSSCTNPKCEKQFARYFCKICVFYDDDKNRNIYHCHSCNVCRAGKGLGIDFFHCMKCNQCMNIKKYYKQGHVCIEKAMESDCPVCHQYLFTSTSPVKHLRCGHLMHKSCFKRYCKERYTCPLCSKSLEEVQHVSRQIDRLLAARSNTSMPREYRFARCDILCLDCHAKSNTPYHFLFNKCPKCSSYNTRVESVDANAGDSFTITDRRN